MCVEALERYISPPTKTTATFTCTLIFHFYSKFNTARVNRIFCLDTPDLCLDVSHFLQLSLNRNETVTKRFQFMLRQKVSVVSHGNQKPPALVYGPSLFQA